MGPGVDRLLWILAIRLSQRWRTGGPIEAFVGVRPPKSTLPSVEVVPFLEPTI